MDYVALAGAARPEFDEVVVALGKRNQPHEKVQLEPPRHVAWLVAHAPDDEVEPFIRREVTPDVAVLLEIKCRYLDWRELVDPEGVLSAGFLICLKPKVEL